MVHAAAEGVGLNIKQFFKQKIFFVHFLYKGGGGSTTIFLGKYQKILMLF